MFIYIHGIYFYVGNYFFLYTEKTIDKTTLELSPNSRGNLFRVDGL